MVLKCAFTFPSSYEKEFTKIFRKLTPFLDEIRRKVVTPGNVNKESQISFTALYELEEIRAQETFQQIFKQIDSFSGIPGFNFSAELLDIESIISSDELGHYTADPFSNTPDIPKTPENGNGGLA